MDRFKEAQARIDAIFETRDETAKPVHDRICSYAKRGVDAPDTLTPQEIREVCYALIIHYAQMGIG